MKSVILELSEELYEFYKEIAVICNTTIEEIMELTLIKIADTISKKSTK